MKTNTQSKPRLKKIRNQQGTTLIEAVVALVVFSIGILGLAGLQTATLIRVSDSEQKTLVSLKMQDIAERIRHSRTQSDPDGLVQEYANAINGGSSFGNANAAGIGNITTVFNCATRAQPSNMCGAVVAGGTPDSCNATQLVTYDVWDVMCNPNTGLATSNPDVGSIGVQNLNVAIVQTAAGSRLYAQWLARATDTQDAADYTTGGTVATELCGTQEALPPVLEAYCIVL